MSRERLRYRLSWFTKLTDRQRDEVIEWLDANGFPGGTGVVSFEIDVIDAPLVRAAVHRLDQNGNSYVLPGEVMAATEVVEKLMRVEPPMWMADA